MTRRPLAAWRSRKLWWIGVASAKPQAAKTRETCHADLPVRGDGHHRRRGERHHPGRQRGRSPAENSLARLLRHATYRNRGQEEKRQEESRSAKEQEDQSPHARRLQSKAARPIHKTILRLARRRSPGSA